MKTISVVTPCFNEEASIVECVETVRSIFEKELPGYALEHIFCDNASTDRTVDLLKNVLKLYSNVKIIVNSRNFGILKNTYNGVLASSGEAIVLFMPVDLQDPPDLIPEMVCLWEKGYEIVYGMRAKSEENILASLIRKTYYRILSRLTYVNYPHDAGDFQLVDRRVLDYMKSAYDAQPFMRLMTFDSGFRSIGIKYTWKARKHGKSHNQFSHMIDQGINGIISFSAAPIRVSLFAGFFMAVLSLLYAISVTVMVLTGKVQSLSGIPTIIVALFFFGGVELFFLGVIGEYVLAIYNQVRHKPLVVERERINF